MLRFGRGLQQVGPQSLVMPSMDLTRLLELLLDLQLLRLCSGRTKGRWGQGGGGGTTRGEGRIKRGGEETAAETGRGRETENMLDRGGGGAVYRQTWKDGVVWREIKKMLNGQETQREQDSFQEHVQSWVDNSQETAGEFMKRELRLFQVLSAHKKF